MNLFEKPRALRATARAALLALAMLAACAAPAPTPAGEQATAPQSDAKATPADQPTPVATAPATPVPDQATTSPQETRQTGGPLPAERVGDRIDGTLDKAPAEVKVDTSCRTDADCTVKNVGNCCGAYPACVNVNSPTDPKGVQERCARLGMGSVCGFPEISGCACVKGTCEASASTGEAVR